MPRKGDEIKIIPTHIIGPNKIYVQIVDSMDFTIFQEVELQAIELKKFNEVDGNKSFLNTRDVITNFKETLYFPEFPKLNGFYLARYTDGEIYRVRLKARIGERFEVMPMMLMYSLGQKFGDNHKMHYSSIFPSQPTQKLS